MFFNQRVEESPRRPFLRLTWSAGLAKTFGVEITLALFVSPSIKAERLLMWRDNVPKIKK
jgi:hypothetical protein